MLSGMVSSPFAHLTYSAQSQDVRARSVSSMQKYMGCSDFPICNGGAFCHPVVGHTRGRNPASLATRPVSHRASMRGCVVLGRTRCECAVRLSHRRAHGPSPLCTHQLSFVPCHCHLGRSFSPTSTESLAMRSLSLSPFPLSPPSPSPPSPPRRPSDRKSTRLNSSHPQQSRMPSSA